MDDVSVRRACRRNIVEFVQLVAVLNLDENRSIDCLDANYDT